MPASPLRVWQALAAVRRIRIGAFVYILRCADGSYYVGSTRASLDERFAQHEAGTFDGYTARRRPLRLVFAQEFQRITDAIAAERQLKGWRPEEGGADPRRLGRAAGAGGGMEEAELALAGPAQCVLRLLAPLALRMRHFSLCHQ